MTQRFGAYAASDDLVGVRCATCRARVERGDLVLTVVTGARTTADGRLALEGGLAHLHCPPRA